MLYKLGETSDNERLIMSDVHTTRTSTCTAVRLKVLHNCLKAILSGLFLVAWNGITGTLIFSTLCVPEVFDSFVIFMSEYSYFLSMISSLAKTIRYICD